MTRKTEEVQDGFCRGGSVHFHITAASQLTNDRRVSVADHARLRLVVKLIVHI